MMMEISKILKSNPALQANIEKLQSQVMERKGNLRSYKSYIQISYHDFKALISAFATEIMLQRSVHAQYIIDKYNEPIIKQLYLYFTNNPECEWNLNAGFVFGGKIGCGKSLLMMAYLKISNEFSRKVTQTIHSKQLLCMIKDRGIEYYTRRPLFVDELGREETLNKDYGNVIKPIIDLFSLRYEAGSRTYATTNFNYESLEKFYGEFIRSRMEETMTFVRFPGESRRLKNQVKNK